VDQGVIFVSKLN